MQFFPQKKKKKKILSVKYSLQGKIFFLVQFFATHALYLLMWIFFTSIFPRDILKIKKQILFNEY